MDIVQFLSDRLAEDEAATGLTSPSPWRVETMPHRTNVVAPAEGIDRVGTAGRRLDITPVFTGQTAGSSRAQWEADAQHIARHDPARVLAEVAAKRELLTYAFKEAARRDAEWGCVHSAEDIRGGRCREEQPDGLFILHALAAPYAGHPDFDSKWRPE